MIRPGEHSESMLPSVATMICVNRVRHVLHEASHEVEWENMSYMLSLEPATVQSVTPLHANSSSQSIDRIAIVSFITTDPSAPEAFELQGIVGTPALMHPCFGKGDSPKVFFRLRPWYALRSSMVSS